MSELPQPLTAPVCDLRGMPYMPLDLIRLFDSDFYALSSGAEFKAGLTLWGKSFYQIPAGSLPDDDRLLEHLSGAKNWPEVKKMVLHGWIKCADGRLYHPTVAEKVAEAWAARLMRRARTQAARSARHKNLSPDPQPQPMESVTDSKGTEQKRTKQKQSPEDSPRPADAEREQEFEAFWRVYPRKVGKGQARRAFQAALKKVPTALIMQALSSQRFDPRERFQPHPATWLNGERWLDEANQGDPVLRAAGLGADPAPQPDPAWSLLQ